MRQRQFFGAEQLRAQSGPLTFRCAVLRISQDGPAHIGAVDTQLVRPAGDGPQGQQRTIRKALQHGKFRYGGLAIGMYFPEKTGQRLAGDGCVDDAAVFLRPAEDQCVISLFG